MKWAAVASWPVLEIPSVDKVLATARLVAGGVSADRARLSRQDGQSLAEYGLILALVVVVAVAGLSPLGGNLGGLVANTFSAVVTML